MRENSDTAIGSSIRISACLKSQMSPDAWAVTNDLDTQPENLFSVNHKLYRSAEFCAWMASENPRRTILTSRVDAEVLFQITFESGRSQRYYIPSLSSCNNFRLRPAIEPFFFLVEETITNRNLAWSKLRNKIFARRCGGLVLSRKGSHTSI
ncbi:hypothetical protein GE21DRAFT_1019615 [Neurospora crassa]|nr:hypothetical protein GE21DRAFT_1019615 [Neurospora crassa]